tara:strand:+ start:164 stop:391 length:228 start_codon:yes stop_codon:yes gene_type:complete
MKKSNKPNIRINRAVKQMTQEGNGHNVGCIIFEEIIRKGINQLKEELKNIDPEKNYIIHPNLFKTSVAIIEKHIF